MNFFENEDRARHRTIQLLVMFAISIIVTVIAVNVVVFVIATAANGYYHVDHVQRVDNFGRPYVSDGYHPIHVVPIVFATTIVTLLIIFGGSAYKTMQLSGGGPTVAQLMGGRPIVPNSPDQNENILRNVVEEMSIASGVPMPRIYILDKEDGINAFAAGYTTNDAVIGVTRGAMTKLNRDELQGVIAHEFSHILNGDMRLNLRLIGWLHGILVVSLVGYTLIRSAPYASGRNEKDGGALMLLLIFGIALGVIGWVGHACASVIQAAVSRQREFLADASAVQFTRNPNGLVSALKKLGKYSQQSRVNNPQAMGAAHMFFGEIAGFSFSQLLATHPPLVDRIRAIDPTFDGKFDYVGKSNITEMYSGRTIPMAADRPQSRPQLDIVRAAGNLLPQNLVMAAGMIASIPDAVTAYAREPFTARAVVFAVLINNEPAVQQKQLSLVQQNVEPACYEALAKILQPINSLGEKAYLPLLDQSLPALRKLSPQQSQQFRAIVKSLIEADGRVTLFEFALFRTIEKQLAPLDQSKREPVEFVSLTPVRDDAVVLLSALAAASTSQTDRAFQIGAACLDKDSPPAMVKVNGLQPINSALKRLSRASPAVKERFMNAATHTVAADGEVNLAEAELLRAIAVTLDVPLPPLVMG